MATIGTLNRKAGTIRTELRRRSKRVKEYLNESKMALSSARNWEKKSAELDRKIRDLSAKKDLIDRAAYASNKMHRSLREHSRDEARSMRSAQSELRKIESQISKLEQKQS